MLLKILPVELVARDTCERCIRWRDGCGSFSRGGGNGGVGMRFGAFTQPKIGAEGYALEDIAHRVGPARKLQPFYSLA